MLRFIELSLKGGTIAEGEDEKMEGETEEDREERMLWHPVSDPRFTMGVTALKLLVLVEGLVDDVLCNSGGASAILLSLLELPDASEAFDLSSDILSLLAPKQQFADACKGELWRLLVVLERKEGGRGEGAGDVEKGKDDDAKQTEEEGNEASKSAKTIAKRQQKGWQILAQMIKNGVGADRQAVSMLLKQITEKVERSKARG